MVPKVNIAVLQVSVVEEVIAFSALDNIRDLTCVSLLALSLEGDFFSNSVIPSSFLSRLVRNKRVLEIFSVLSQHV